MSLANVLQLVYIEPACPDHSVCSKVKLGSSYCGIILWVLCMLYGKVKEKLSSRSTLISVVHYLQAVNAWLYIL